MLSMAGGPARFLLFEYSDFNPLAGLLKKDPLIPYGVEMDGR